MVSKRSRYVSESTTDDETCDMDYNPNNQKTKTTRKPTRVPKCFTKNALMARENRLKKKMYMSNLEGQVSALKNENRKLSDLVQTQAVTINNFKKEVLYLKSVIANSEDIRKLIRNINVNTGLTVTTSLDKELADSTTSVGNSPLYKQVVPDVESLSRNAQKQERKRHPWEEQDSSYENYPTPESTYSYYSSPGFEELKNEGLLLDLDLPIEMDSDELLNLIDERALDTSTVGPEESSYQDPVKEEKKIENDDQDVGVCLHVSKNKVSLEFCPTCCDNARSWKIP